MRGPCARPIRGRPLTPLASGIALEPTAAAAASKRTCALRKIRQPTCQRGGAGFDADGGGMRPHPIQLRCRAATPSAHPRLPGPKMLYVFGSRRFPPPAGRVGNEGHSGSRAISIDCPRLRPRRRSCMRAFAHSEEGFNQRLPKDGAPSNKSTNRRGGPRTRERKNCGVVVEVLAGAFPWGRLLLPAEAGSGAGGRSAFARITVPSLGPADGFGLLFFGSDRGRVKSPLGQWLLGLWHWID